METDPITEFSNVIVGFEVVDRSGEHVGTVKKVNLARTCVTLKMGKSRLSRHADRSVHIASVRGIDLDAFTIRVAATKEQIEEAPELRELNDASEAEIKSYYEDIAPR